MIGNTPLLEIRCRFRGSERVIHAKAEHINMTGSIKDRMAFHILRNAYRQGLIAAGDTIVEATSGNTGISFSAIGRALGHEVVIFMPNWMSAERVALRTTTRSTSAPTFSGKSRCATATSLPRSSSSASVRSVACARRAWCDVWSAEATPPLLKGRRCLRTPYPHRDAVQGRVAGNRIDGVAGEVVVARLPKPWGTDHAAHHRVRRLDRHAHRARVGLNVNELTICPSERRQVVR